MEELKSGSVVQLKSGGPTMVVEQTLVTDTNAKLANCIWYSGISGNGFFREQFRIEALKTVVADENKPIPVE